MLNEEMFEETILKLEKFYGLPGQVVGDEFIQDVYYQTLKNLSERSFRSGVAKCIRDNPKQYGFFPSAKQLLEYSEGEYIPPGETGALRKLNIPVLPDSEMRMTSEQKEEIRHRGTLQAKILVYGGRFMTHDEKSAFMDSLKLKPTHELEAIATQAERAQATTRGLQAPESIQAITERLKQNFQVDVAQTLVRENHDTQSSQEDDIEF